MIACFKATDMTFHFEIVNQYKSKLKEGAEFVPESPEDTQLMLNLMMHAANHRNIFVPPSVTKSRILDRHKQSYDENANLERIMEKTILETQVEKSRDDDENIKLRSYQVELGSDVGHNLNPL